MRPEQRRRRLVARHHLHGTAPSLRAATRDLIALHSSDPLTPHLALRARVPGYVPAHLDEALRAGLLWRTHAMRRTLWVADREDVPMLSVDAAVAVAAKERRRLRGWLAQITDDADAWLAGVEAEVAAAVAANPGITSRQLTAQLAPLSERVTVGSGKWTSEVPVGSRLLMVMAMELALFRLPASSWRNSQYPWAPPPALTAAPAEGSLLRRYLARFGPVTLVDLKWWTGWTAARVNRHLPKEAVERDGLWSLPTDDAAVGVPGEPEPRGVALLPGLDPTPMGYKERGFFLGELGPQLFDRNGNVGPTVWLDGQLVGGWAAAPDVRLGLLVDVGAEGRARIEAEAHRLEAWLGGAVTPRFRTPLERSLSG